jgi:putative thiamine transport system permease protein
MSRFHLFALIMRILLMVTLSVPVMAGLIGVLLPAFGFFPALGSVDFSFDAFRMLFAVDDVAWMVWLSFSTGLIATAVACLGAMALLAVFYRHAWLEKIQHMLSPLLVLPHAAAAISLLFMLSPSGWLARLITWGGEDSLPPEWGFPYDQYGFAIILALSLKELPFIFLMALSVLAQPQLKANLQGYYRSAIALGYSPVTAFIKGVMPVIYPHIRLPLLAVLAFATANVEIPLILGPNNPSTLAVAVVHWFNHVDLSMRYQASAAAVLQLLVTAFALLCWWLLERGLSFFAKGQIINGARQQGCRCVIFIAYITLLLYVFAALTMVVSMLMWSFASHWPFPALIPDGATLLHWQTALSALSVPIGNTLLIGGTVSLFSVVLALLALEAETAVRNTYSSRWRQFDSICINTTLFMPLLVPGVAFLFGLVWFQQSYVTDTVWLPVLVSHLVYVLPYVFISLAVAYRRLDPRFVKVAYGLGQSPLRVFFKMKIPMLFPPIMVAFALGLAISYSQYLATLLSAGGRIATVTTEAVAVASGSSSRLSAVYVIVQAAMPLLGFILAWWLPKIIFNPGVRFASLKKGTHAHESNIR